MKKRRNQTAISALALALAASWSLPAAADTGAAPAAPTPQYQRTAPAGAPNIVLVLLDDVGFGLGSTFGGAARTPAMDALAKDGLRYNRFHTTAICSPTRASLLTGRNPHATGIGAVMNGADARPGYSGFHTKDTATIATILQQNGYSTAAFGKWHQTPDWEVSQVGPFDRWPTGEGFDKFYGFQGGETDQFEPTLYDGTTPVMRPPGKDYHLTDDLVDHSIQWLQSQEAVTPDRPFFLYLATGGIHAPIQVPESYIEHYRGKFDQGWDKLREEVFARQKKLGIIPANTKLTPRPEGMPAWDSMTPDQKKFASRLMESYAAFLEHTDVQVGRLVQSLKDSGQYDNTLFIYVVGDNGASAEGGLEGSLNYMGTLQGLPEPEAGKLAGMDRIGTAESYAHVNSAWAWATNSPFQWTKTVASHLGGTRNPLIVTWPKKITDKGGLRSQFGHVNDIAPTILDILGLQAPAEVNGIAQKPMNGVSLAYSFNDAKAAERHTTQYFEVFGHRAIYHDGWMASAFHNRLPWKAFSLGNKPFEEDKWELYDLRTDFSQANDLAAKQPAKLEEMKALFMQQAAANQVLPLKGQSMSKKGLPDLAEGRTKATYRQGTISVPETAVPHMANRSWSLSSDVNVADQAQGVIATIGGTAAGWSLYIDPQRRPVFTYRLFDLKTVNLVGAPLPAGRNALRVDFDYDGKGFAKGGKLSLLVNGAPAASDTIPASPPSMFSINETFDVGLDTGSAAGRYPETAPLGYPIAGAKIDGVTIELR
ncbi:arylsulfatase [Sphingomonas laterariae]|uniref:Arylsulfatase n=1 Tax=Edaphosphingomonas laterariae TaxID=861865 RepID=A0A239GCE7_9SPHN|nr:arylsulfatase [Sphingomonas laterariae]SNS65724.1 arylsulfatase [Sphingomonas laterariae]